MKLNEVKEFVKELKKCLSQEELAKREKRIEKNQFELLPLLLSSTIRTIIALLERS